MNKGEMHARLYEEYVLGLDTLEDELLDTCEDWDEEDWEYDCWDVLDDDDWEDDLDEDDWEDVLTADLDDAQGVAEDWNVDALMRHINDAFRDPPPWAEAGH